MELRTSHASAHFLIMWNAHHRYQSGNYRMSLDELTEQRRTIFMKKLTLSFWLALAAAGVFVIEAAGPSTHQSFGDPIPTCPPLCSAR
jgi:hypothetical protein